MENKIERLREIVNRGKVNEKEKKFIEDLSQELEVAFDPKSSTCKDCYVDQAVVLFGKLNGKSKGDARLRDDIDVVINGVRINNATLTPELVEKYRGKGLPEHWFV